MVGGSNPPRAIAPNSLVGIFTQTMDHFIESFIITSKKKYEVIDITAKINDVVRKSKIQEGTCHVFLPHTTAAIFLMETWDKNLGPDLLGLMDELVPKGKWLHDKVDDNGEAHLKSALLGVSKTIPMHDGKIILGQWRGVVLAEFDGPRERVVHVRVF